jgi:hypothetical protein
VKIYSQFKTKKMKLKNVFSIIAVLSVVFFTGCKKNYDPILAAPTVTSTDPGVSATGVALNHLILINFSEEMDPATITSMTFTLNQGSTSVSGAVTYAGTTAIFTPAANLVASKIYTGLVTTGARNMTGNALEVNYTFNFTTGSAADVTLPAVISTSPLNSTTDVARNKVVSIIFSEPMNPLTLTALTFTLKQGATVVSGSIGYSGTTATFTSSDVLAASSVYTATITNGAKDLAGNALAANTEWSFTTGGSTLARAAVNLGTAANFVILAKTKVSTTGTTHVTGDIGISPAAATFITGFALTLPAAGAFSTSALVTGNIYAPGYAAPTPANLTTAVGNMEAAYTDAAGRTLPDFTELYTGNLGGKTLSSGLYKWTNNVSVPSSVVISGSATDVWIFQIAGNLNVSSAVNVTLTGGALAKNIFWQVAGTATFGTTSHFEGIILSKTGITFQTGASINGRALAQTAVVLDANAVTKPQ